MADNLHTDKSRLLSKSESKLKLLFEFLFQTLCNEFKNYWK